MPTGIMHYADPNRPRHFTDCPSGCTSRHGGPEPKAEAGTIPVTPAQARLELEAGLCDRVISLRKLASSRKLAGPAHQETRARLRQEALLCVDLAGAVRRADPQRLADVLAAPSERCSECGRELLRDTPDSPPYDTESESLYCHHTGGRHIPVTAHS